MSSTTVCDKTFSIPLVRQTVRTVDCQFPIDSIPVKLILLSVSIHVLIVIDVTQNEIPGAMTNLVSIIIREVGLVSSLLSFTTYRYLSDINLQELQPSQHCSGILHQCQLPRPSPTKTS